MSNHLLKSILVWGFAISTLPFSISYSKVLISILGTLSFQDNTSQFFILGLILGIIMVLILYKRKTIRLLISLEHELTHFLWAILTFNKPVSINASSQGEGVYTHEGKGNIIITLSPYFFPTIIFFLLPLYIIIDQSYYPLFHSLIGFFTGYHLVTDIKDIHKNQSDLKRYGFFQSIIIIFFFNIISYIIIFGFVSCGMQCVWQYLLTGLNWLI